MKSSVALLAAGIGFVTGLRSMTAPAAVAVAANRGALHVKGTPLARLANPRAAGALVAAAGAEYVADKLSITPARTNFFSLVVRAAAGSFAGAAIGVASSSSVRASALLGGACAVAGSFVGYYGRAAAVRSLGSEDWPVALSEDAIAAGLATLIVTAV